MRATPLFTAAALLGLLLAGGCASGPAPAASSATASSATAPHAPPPADAAGLRALLADAGLQTAPLDSFSFILEDPDAGVQLVVFREDQGASLQAVMAYPAEGHAAPGALQRWNATRRFGRAYVDTRGAPVLASDLALGPGIGRKAVVAWAELVLALAERFQREVWPAAGPPADPLRE